MAAKSSTEQLFAQISDQYRGLISRITLSYEADGALRKELMQDVLLAIWLALPSYRGDASLKTFVASIAQKRSISHVIRRAREPRQVELASDLVCAQPAPDAAAEENDLRKQLVDAIQQLPLPQREAIVLTLEGFSYGEVSEVLGISVNAATLRCQRAKAALRAIMDEDS